MGLLDLLGLLDLVVLFESVRILKIWIRGQADGRVERHLERYLGKQTFSRKHLVTWGRRGRSTGFSGNKTGKKFKH